MPALRSKVLHVKMLENDNFREYTYPELFNGATPDFCHVQSVGNRVDKSEPDVGRDSVRFSNGYAIAGQTWCSANTADASGPTCMHTQTYSYVNLPTPESDDSSGTTRQSRGTVTLIPNGIRVTNDSAYTTENHNVIISIVGGTDIEEVAMLRVTNNDADGTEASSSGMKWAMPFKGCNFMLTLGGGGPVDVVHNAFQEAHGAIWCTNGGGGNNGFGGTYSSNYTTRSSRIAYTGNSPPSRNYDYDGGTGDWSLQGDYKDATKSNQPSSDGIIVRDVSRNTASGATPNNVSFSFYQMGDYGVDPLGQPELGFDNNSGAEWIQPVPSEDETDADVCVYMLCIKFNYTGDNVTWYASDNAHPFSYFSDWGGTTQGGGGDAAYYGSTKGGPLERSSYYVGGSTNKANHWVATSTARFTEKPITWGFLDQYQGGGNGDQGSSMSRFQFDTKIGIDTESNSGEEPTFGAGIGWAKKGSTYDGGFPESYMFTAPNLYAAITDTTTDISVGQLTSISTEYNQTSFPNQTIRDGAGTRVVNTIVSSFESVVNAQLAVSYDDRGVIESIELQDDGAGSSSFKYGQPIFVQFQVNVEPSGSAAIRAELYAAGIDGNDAFAQGERTKISRGMTFNNDGSILFDVQPTGYPYSLAFVPNMLIALSASDGSGNGSDGGGGGDLGGNISAIYYGSTPVSTVYYGSTSIAAINLGAS